MELTRAMLCTRALRRVGALGAGETADSDDLATAREHIDEMLNTWQTQKLVVLVTEQVSIPLITLRPFYTIGDGGDFDRQRPEWVERMSYVLNASTSQPLEKPLSVIDLGQWQGIPVKSTQSTLPQVVYYEPSFPLGKLYTWPLYIGSDTELKGYFPTTFDGFVSDSGVHDFAPAYVQAMVWGLTALLLTNFPRSDKESDRIEKRAAKTLGDLKRVNIRPQQISVDPALVGSRRHDFYNWLTDSYSK
jgi:hypothetical protein